MNTNTSTTHRAVCICHPPNALAIDRALCIAHGTAAQSAYQAITNVHPGTWAIQGGGHAYLINPAGLELFWQIREIEWHRADALRTRNRSLALPTFHVDIYRAVIAEMLSPSDLRQLRKGQAQPTRTPKIRRADHAVRG